SEAIFFGIKRYVLRDLLAGVPQQGREFAAIGVELDRDAALVHPARDGALAKLTLNASHLRERHQGTAARREEEAADRFRGVARGFRKLHRRSLVPLTDEHLTDGTAADACLDEIRNVGDIYAVPRCGRAVDLDSELRQRRLLVDIEGGIYRAGHGLQGCNDVIADAAHLVEVVAEDAHDELAV